MPLPEPTSSEDRGEFIERCMGDGGAKDEFPEQSQRFAFCQTRWENMRKSEGRDSEFTKADMPRTLFIKRSVVNADDVIRWAKDQGFKTAITAEDMHVTVAFSNRPLDWFSIPDTLREVRVPAGGVRFVEQLGPKGAVVLRFKSDALTRRHEQILEHGASWDFDSFRPHLTITLKPGKVDLEKVDPFQGELILGIEKFEEVRENAFEGITEKISRVSVAISKVDKDKMLAFGWFSVIEEDGKAVVDSHGDVILEDTLMEAAHNFITESRSGKVMHQGRRVADVVESVVFTKDLQKALGIDLGLVGWFGAMKFRDSKIWEKVKSGELSAFSIGGIARRTKI